MENKHATIIIEKQSNYIIRQQNFLTKRNKSLGKFRQIKEMSNQTLGMVGIHFAEHKSGPLNL